MTNRNTIGIIVIISLLFVDLLIYKYQKANSPKGIIRCYPPGKAYLQMDLSDTIKYVQSLKNNYHEK
jgi:hypothetical protein